MSLRALVPKRGLQQPPATPGDDLDYPGYDDPHVDMPVDDEDMPPS